MAEQDLKQVMLDAIADADSLEQFINGSDSETVLTRLSAEYPTLKNAIKTLFENGGLPATPFKTKASMEASSLSSDTYAVVTDDATPSNNGLYLNSGGNWSKSKYEKSDVVSPNFKGSPTTPTVAHNTKSDVIASTKFVHDLVTYKNSALVGISLIDFDKDEYVVSEAQYEANNFNVFGSPKREVTIVVPSSPLKLLLVNNQTYGNDIYIKTSTDTSRRKLETGATFLLSIGTSLLTTYDSKAPISSPFFQGTPRANTQTPDKYDTEIATTQFARRASQGVMEEQISDSTTLLREYGSSLVTLVGSLTKDVIVTITRNDHNYTLVNMTTGGHNVIVRGSGQNSQSTYITLRPREGKRIYVVGTVAHESSSLSSSHIPPATNSSLGGVKVGSGLRVTSDGTLSAIGSPSIDSGVSTYVGKFKEGSDYISGDIVEHGSGIYKVISNSNNVASPLASPAFVKVAHNDYAGANRELTVISSSKSNTPLGSFESPIKMSRSGRIVFNNGSNPLKISRDWGKTWEKQPVFAPEGSSWFRWTNELEDGELLCGVSQTDGSNPDKSLIYRSNGWDEETGVAESWSLVHQIQRSGALFVNWGFSQHKNFVLLAEYGLQRTSLEGSGNSTYGRFCYLSKDYGKTWETIFDLSEHTENIKVHLHGICFDPYWNRIWVSHGDGDNGGEQGLYYSDDLGKTWVDGLGKNEDGSINFPQSVGMVALPTCILLSSDSYPNGLHRIDRAQGRIPHKGYYTVEAAYYIKDQQNVLHHILGEARKAEWLPDAPYIWTYKPQTISGKSGCIASWDGWTFYDVWESDEIYTPTFGAHSVVGVTPENEIIISGDTDTVDASKHWQVVVKISMD